VAILLLHALFSSLLAHRSPFRLLLTERRASGLAVLLGRIRNGVSGLRARFFRPAVAQGSAFSMGSGRLRRFRWVVDPDAAVGMADRRYSLVSPSVEVGSMSNGLRTASPPRCGTWV
jgi:hypothetical protein